MPVKLWLLVTALVCTLCLVGMEQQAQAQNYRAIEDASPQEVVDGMANKLARGVANLATGWFEFPKQIYTTSREQGLARGLTLGPIKGLGMTLGRTLSGVGEAATFFIPLPGFFDPLYDPPYVWQTE